MQIPLNKLFNVEPWTEDITGTGSITYQGNPENAQSDGDLVECIGDNVSGALIYHDLSLAPSETIIIDVQARNLTGFDTEDTRGSIYIESPIGTRVAEIFVQGDAFNDQLPLVWTAPFNEGFAMQAIRIVFGSSTTRNSQCQFYRPRARVSNGILASRRVLMDGDIDITAGVYTLLTDGDHFNVDSAAIVRNAGTGELDIGPHMEASMPFRGKVQLTPIRSGAATKYYIEARYTTSTGKISVGFFDFTTSAAVDVNALVGSQRFSFVVYI